jgi:DNA polymerase III alpha subunit
MMESLVLSSACDGFGISRSKMMAVIEPFCRTVQDANKSVMEGQVSFFDLTKDVSLSLRSEPDYPDTPPFSTLESLAMEKEMTGLYVTGHPLHAYEKSIKALPLVRSDELRPRQTDDDADDIEQEDDKAELSDIELNPSTPAPINFIDRDRVIMAGLMASRRDLFTKNNDRMAFLTLEDQGGRLDVVVFPKTYASYRDVMDEHQVLVIAGQLDLRDDDDPKLLADVIAPMTEDMVKLPTSIRQKGYTKRHARGNRNGRRNGSNGYGKNERRRASYSSSKESENKSAKSTGSASGEMNARQRASSQKELSASDHNIHPADKTLVIRIPNEAPPAFREALEAALAFFSGKMPIRIYDEASGSLVKPRETSGIQWNRENAELLIDRFGRENFGYL